jgi:hypothetical protein
LVKRKEERGGKRVEGRGKRGARLRLSINRDCGAISTLSTLSTVLHHLSNMIHLVPDTKHHVHTCPLIFANLRPCPRRVQRGTPSDELEDVRPLRGGGGDDDLMRDKKCGSHLDLDKDSLSDFP